MNPMKLCVVYDITFLGNVFPKLMANFCDDVGLDVLGCGADILGTNCKPAFVFACCLIS